MSKLSREGLEIRARGLEKELKKTQKLNAEIRVLLGAREEDHKNEGIEAHDAPLIQNPNAFATGSDPDVTRRRALSQARADAGSGEIVR